MTHSLHVAVLGGGASGMVAAIAAARAGARVTLLERQDRVGRKLLATGNGRCNVTNTDAAPSHYRCGCPDALATVLDRFPVARTLAFFEDLGLLVRQEEEGRVYPATGQASTVLDVLRLELERTGAAVRTQAEVKSATQRGSGFSVRLADAEITADRVIVCTGGKAAPQLGGIDAGPLILKRLGHSSLPQYPALVPLVSQARYCKHLKGLRAIACSRLEVLGRIGRTEEGEVQFTDFGLSGIPILQLSLEAAADLGHLGAVRIVLDLFPQWTVEQLTSHLGARCSARPDLSLDNCLVGLAHKRLVQVALEETGLSARTPAGQVDGSGIRALAAHLKGWAFPITGAHSWNDAQVMVGGADLREFEPSTLESRRVRGLFAAGEVLDVAGECGGYNLQWAWSSGYVAGSSAAAV